MWTHTRANPHRHLSSPAGGTQTQSGFILTLHLCLLVTVHAVSSAPTRYTHAISFITTDGSSVYMHLVAVDSGQSSFAGIHTFIQFYQRDFIKDTFIIDHHKGTCRRPNNCATRHVPHTLIRLTIV